MNTVLSNYVADRGWPAARSRRLVDGLRLLQELAAAGDRPVTYGEFAEQVQSGLAPLAASRVLDDIGTFCAAAGWPNVTCFVVSARTGEPSPGCRHIGPEGAAVARERARRRYARSGNGPLAAAVPRGL